MKVVVVVERERQKPETETQFGRHIYAWQDISHAVNKDDDDGEIHMTAAMCYQQIYFHASPMMMMTLSLCHVVIILMNETRNSMKTSLIPNAKL